MRGVPAELRTGKLTRRNGERPSRRRVLALSRVSMVFAIWAEHRFPSPWCQEHFRKWSSLFFGPVPVGSGISEDQNAITVQSDVGCLPNRASYFAKVSALKLVAIVRVWVGWIPGTIESVEVRIVVDAPFLDGLPRGSDGRERLDLESSRWLARSDAYSLPAIRGGGGKLIQEHSTALRPPRGTSPAEGVRVSVQNAYRPSVFSTPLAADDLMSRLHGSFAPWALEWGASPVLREDHGGQARFAG